MLKLTLTREELAELLGVKMQTLAAWAVSGRGPRFTKRRHRAIYRRADVAAWLDDPAAYEASRASASTSTTCPS